jgi:hypothetical protein
MRIAKRFIENIPQEGEISIHILDVGDLKFVEVIRTYDFEWSFTQNIWVKIPFEEPFTEYWKLLKNMTSLLKTLFSSVQKKMKMTFQKNYQI